MRDLKFEDLPKASEEILEKLEQVQQELNALKQRLEPKEREELLTREETAEYLKISLSTLWHWSKKGILPSYGIGCRVYY